MQDNTPPLKPEAGTQKTCLCREPGHMAVTHLIDILADHVIPQVYDGQGPSNYPFMVRSTLWQNWQRGGHCNIAFNQLGHVEPSDIGADSYTFASTWLRKRLIGPVCPSARSSKAACEAARDIVHWSPAMGAHALRFCCRGPLLQQGGNIRKTWQRCGMCC